MRVLIGYDGSLHSDEAIRSLDRAGLSSAGEALIVTAADVNGVSAAPASPLPPGRAATSTAMVYADNTAERGAVLARTVLRGWSVRGQADPRPARDALLGCAASWPADLVVIGSRGRRGLKRLVLGSVAAHVIRDAPCSVRVGRCPISLKTIRRLPPVVLVAVDGSDGSNAAVAAIAARAWPVGTKVIVLSVLDTRIMMLAGECPMIDVPPLSAEEKSTTSERTAALDAAMRLESAGLPTKAEVLAGDPVQLILAQSAQTGADCIFLGATGIRRLERLLLGRIAGTVAEQAPCSVEIIRPLSAEQGRLSRSVQRQHNSYREIPERRESLPYCGVGQVPIQQSTASGKNVRAGRETSSIKGDDLSPAVPPY